MFILWVCWSQFLSLERGLFEMQLETCPLDLPQLSPIAVAYNVDLSKTFFLEHEETRL